MALMNGTMAHTTEACVARKTLRDFVHNLPRAWGLGLIHGFALLSVLVFPPSLPALALALAVYVVGMFGATAGYHRYFSHKSFKTSRVGAFLLAWLAQTSLQRGVLWWAAHHRHHHRYSDQPEDLHSPEHHGTLHAHVGWIISEEAEGADLDRVKDLSRFAELRWLDRHWWVPGASLLVALGAVGGLIGGWTGAGWAMAWGFAVPIVALFHGVFTINSLSHTWGRRVYATTDTSRNNALLALITLGEGWHNNHHRYPTSCRQGFVWWQVDLTFWALTALSWLGLVRDLKAPPQRILDERSPTSLPAVLSASELAWRQAQAAVRVAEGTLQRAALAVQTAEHEAYEAAVHAHARALEALAEARRVLEGLEPSPA